MGWIAGVACTVIAGVLFYKFVVESLPTEALEENLHVNKATATFENDKSGLSSDYRSSEKSQKSVPKVLKAQLPLNTRSEKPLNPQLQNEPQNRIEAVRIMETPDIPNLMPPPRPKSPPRLKPPTIGPAPPKPGGMSLRPPPSLAASLRVPPQKALPNTSMAPSSLMAPPKNVSRQVKLEPGHSPLDWAALTSNPNNNLRGKDAFEQLMRVTPSRLKKQNGRKGTDTWTVYQGKVYNITPYIPFHPGGKGEILRGAGKDSAKLFMEVHPWVNWDGMLGECLVGILVSEEEMTQRNELDEMD